MCRLLAARGLFGKVQQFGELMAGAMDFRAGDGAGLPDINMLIGNHEQSGRVE